MSSSRRHSGATVVISAMPPWVRASTAKALFGVPPNKLRQWVIKGVVTAKKCDLLRNSATIYNSAHIIQAIETLPDARKWISRGDSVLPENQDATNNKQQNGETQNGNNNAN